MACHSRLTVPWILEDWLDHKPEQPTHRHSDHGSRQSGPQNALARPQASRAKPDIKTSLKKLAL
jgi:hypothetical protein